MKAKDPDTFTAAIGNMFWGVEVAEDKEKGAFALLLEAGIPGSFYDSNGDEYEVDGVGHFLRLVEPLVLDGEVLVLTVCGREGMRYLGGYAMALHVGTDKEIVGIDTNNIYGLAETTFGVEYVSAAEY